MASLIPENIPSRNDIPERLRTAARLLRDATPGDVVVSLERTGDDRASAQRLDLGYEDSDFGTRSIPYLIVFDPAAGVLVLESPSLRSPSAAKRGRFRKQRPVGLDQAQSAIIARVNGLQEKIKSLLVARALALPDVSRNQPLALADEKTPRLFLEDFDEANLLTVVRQILGGQRPPLDNQDQAQVRAAINPNIVIGSQGQMFDTTPQTSEETVRVLDLAQERLAEHLGPGYRLIRGVAGSGKTLVLTHRARYIGENMPRWRILLVCFNVALAQALKLELRDVENVTVSTIDSLANKVIRQAGRTPTEGGGDAFEVRRKEAFAAAQILPRSRRYDMVLVDEAQDLGNSGLDLSWAMGRHELGEEQRHFIIALDSAQNVYRRKMNWNPPGVTARGRSTILRENYRNTKQTLDFALGVIAGIGQPSAGQASPDDLDAFVMPEAALRLGKPPNLQVCSDLVTEAETLTEATAELLRNGATHDDIVIMSGSKKLRITLQQTLRAMGIEALDAQQEREQLVSVRGKIRVATLQLLKGLEYPHVLIGGVNDIWVNGDEDETRQRLLYVAMTRATETLTVTYSGDGPMGRLLQAVPR
ncbi:MAG: ATP-binding domain-containing protein [Acidimicrobiia bacterium]|nr:ATP-binding domain-containing protein [Acidimicrobiia bacterium]MCY4434522.1 AAA family ATPase [bacterium]